MGGLGLAASLGQGAWRCAANGGRSPWTGEPAFRRCCANPLDGPSNLSAPEREELRALLSELDLGQVLRERTMRTARRGFPYANGRIVNSAPSGRLLAG